MRSGMIIAFLSALQLGAGPSCDQAAGAQAPAGAAAHVERSDGSLVEGETCTRTDDCPRSGHCVDGRCVPTARSLQGEVLAERGARMLANDRFQDGADAFRAAAQAYRDREIAVPSSVSCGLARSLLALNDRGALAADGREGMARALSTCLSGAPAGAAVADPALAGLAQLSERGLDTAALDRPDATLMTGRDPRPTADNTHVRMALSGNGDGARATLHDLVGTDPLRQEVLRCFLQWWSVSHESHADGTLRVGFSRGVDDYEELAAAHVTVAPVDVPVSASGADAGSAVHWVQCAAGVVQTAAAGAHWPSHQEHWAETITVHVGPDG